MNTLLLDFLHLENGPLRIGNVIRLWFRKWSRRTAINEAIIVAKLMERRQKPSSRHPESVDDAT